MTALGGPFHDPASHLDSPTSNDPYERLADLRRQWSLGRRDVATLSALGTLLWQLYEFKEAESIFSELQQHPEVDSQTLRHIAHRYFERGRFASSAQVMRQAVSVHPHESAELLTTYAWTLERDHQVEAARELAERAERIDPSYGPAIRLLAHLDRRALQFDVGLARLESHLGKFPGPFDWGLQYERAAILDRLDRFDDAWAALDHAKQLLTPDTRPHLQRLYAIGARQQELSERITSSDLERWRNDGPSQNDCSTSVSFLTGFPRSGTTLLEQILSSHPRVINTDESDILSSQFIAPVVWQARESSDALIELRGWQSDELVTGRRVFLEFTQNYLETSLEGRILLEKNPLLTADIPLAYRLFPDSAWIFALRDPRDVILSFLFTMVPLHWTSAAAINVTEACRFYAATMSHLLWWRDRLPAPMHFVRYELMLDDPESQLAPIFRQWNLPWDADLIDARHRTDRRAVRTPTYYDVTQPLYRRAIGRWQNYEHHLKKGLPLLERFIGEWGAERSE